LLSRAVYLLGPLDEAAVREAILAPARLGGVAFESAEMVEALVHATVSAPRGLGTLQRALSSLWDGRDRDGARITQAAFDGLVLAAPPRGAAAYRVAGPRPSRARRSAASELRFDDLLHASQTFRRDAVPDVGPARIAWLFQMLSCEQPLSSSARWP